MNGTFASFSFTKGVLGWALSHCVQLKLRYHFEMWKAVSFLLLLASSSFAGPQESLQSNFMKKFQGANIRFPLEGSKFEQKNPGRYPAVVEWFFQGLNPWVPKGEIGNYEAGCNPKVWGQSLRQLRFDAAKKAQLLQRYLDDCQKSLQTGTNARWASSYKMMSIDLNLNENPFFHRVVLKMPGDIYLKGRLALKGDLKKRPLVVIRLGMFANVEEFYPERHLLIQLFEEGLSNVLVIENMTGADFIADNSKYSFAGYEEGLQNIYIAKLLQDTTEPLSKLVSSIHFFGSSLGGHGVLFSSLLNELNFKKKNAIKSFTLLCPVVHLKPTIENLTRKTWRNTITDYWIYTRLKGLASLDPLLGRYSLWSVFKGRPQFLPRALEMVEESFKGGLSRTTAMKLPKGYPAGEFWSANDFWPFYKKVKAPVMVFANPVDDLVPFASNASWLLENQKYFHSNMGVVIFEKGFHCTLPVTYDWHFISRMLNEQVLSASPELKILRQYHELALQGRYDHAQIVEQRITFSDSGSVRFHFKLQAKQEQWEAVTQLPVTRFDFVFHNSQLRNPEKQMLERWLNQNLQVDLVQQPKQSVIQLSWPSL